MRDFHPKARGEHTEAAVLEAFLSRGVPVSVPFGDNQRYDMVLDVSGDLYRAQVKTGRLENGCLRFQTRSSATLTRSVEKEGYTDQADVFAVTAPDVSETYVVPVSEAPETSMSLRLAPPEKPSPNINRASEFAVEEWLADRR